MSQPVTIPLRYASGGIIDPEFNVSYVVQNLGHFRVKRNKRGNITAAFWKERSATVPLSTRGVHFEQVLESGRPVHALKGVRGSERG